MAVTNEDGIKRDSGIPPPANLTWKETQLVCPLISQLMVWGGNTASIDVTAVGSRRGRNKVANRKKNNGKSKKKYKINFSKCTTTTNRGQYE